MPKFTQDILTEKQAQKLANWNRWNRAMKLLRAIHNEIAPKLAALHEAQNKLDSFTR